MDQFPKFNSVYTEIESFKEQCRMASSKAGFGSYTAEAVRNKRYVIACGSAKKVIEQKGRCPFRITLTPFGPWSPGSEVDSWEVTETILEHNHELPIPPGERMKIASGEKRKEEEMMKELDGTRGREDLRVEGGDGKEKGKGKGKGKEKQQEKARPVIKKEKQHLNRNVEDQPSTRRRDDNKDRMDVDRDVVTAPSRHGSSSSKISSTKPKSRKSSYDHRNSSPSSIVIKNKGKSRSSAPMSKPVSSASGSKRTPEDLGQRSKGVKPRSSLDPTTGHPMTPPKVPSSSSQSKSLYSRFSSALQLPRDRYLPTALRTSHPFYSDLHTFLLSLIPPHYSHPLDQNQSSVLNSWIEDPCLTSILIEYGLEDMTSLGNLMCFDDEELDQMLEEMVRDGGVSLYQAGMFGTGIKRRRDEMEWVI